MTSVSIGSPRTARTAPARRRARRALVVVLALGASVGVAATAPPAAQAVDAVGTVQPPAAGWTYATTPAGTSATAPLPGDAAALPPVTISAPAGSPVAVTRSSDNVPFVSQTAAAVTAVTNTCLVGATVGVPRDCGRTGTATITFPQPVVNPTLAVAVGGGVNTASLPGAGYSWCSRTWQNVRILGVDGKPTAAGDVSLLGTTTSYTWDAASNALAVIPTVAPGAECKPVGNEWARIGISGLVSSVQVDISMWSMVTHRVTGSATPSPPGGAWVVPYVPAADLALAATAPAVVDAEGEVSWDVTVRNAGGAASHGYVVHNAVPDGVTGVELVAGPPGCVLDGQDVRCAVAPPGCTAEQHDTVVTWAEVDCAVRRDADAVVLAAKQEAAPIRLTGTAPAPRGTVLANTAVVAGADVDLVASNNTAQADTTVEAPTLQIGVTGTQRAHPADQWQLAARSSDTSVLTLVTQGSASERRSEPVQVERGRVYTVVAEMADGSVNPVERYATTLVCTDGTGADVPVSGAGPWTVTPDENRAYTCLVTSTPRPRSFTVEKSASTTAARPGDTVTYTLEVTNTGGVPYTDTDPASFADDLSGVLDDATYADDATGGLTRDGDTLDWFGTLAVGETRTFTYGVTVRRPATGDGVLVNTVRTAEGSGGSCAQDAPDPGCSTSTTVEVVTEPVLVEKVTDGGQRLDGAEFEVLDDAGGAPGTVLTDAAVATGETGLSRFDVLAPGSYWLRETRAPSGYELLAEPVAFTVSRGGAVSLTDPEAAPQVSVSPDGTTVSVVDVHRLELPHAGAGGRTPLYLTGAALLLGAGALAAARARRSRAGQSVHTTTEENA